MNNHEAAEFFETEVKGRFGKWQPEDVLISDWIGYLTAFSLDVAREAIRELCFGSRFNTPNLGKFYGIAKKIRDKKCPVSGVWVNPMRWTQYEVRCTSGSRKGFKKTAAIKKEYAGNDDAEMGEAMKLAEFFKGRYGGEWEYVKLNARPSEAHSESIPKDFIPF